MTTLPPLPIENEDPWWTKRNNFDLAVKAILEGRLSEEEMANLYSNFISTTIVTTRGDLLVATGNSDLDRLAVGVSGQVLLADAASPSGVKWSDELNKYIPMSTVTTRGDIIAGTGLPGAGGVTKLSAGTDAYVLVADSTKPSGLAWSNQLQFAMDKAQEAMNLATETALEAITSVVVEYAVSASDTVPPSTGWSTTQPPRTPGTYIWSRTITTYGDDSTQTSSPVLLTGNNGTPGTPGVGVSSTAVTYQVHSNGTTAPTGTWQATPQATVPGQFLWTRTITTYTNATTSTGYSVAAHGSTGATGTPGVGVSSTAVTYQVGSSGTTAPVSTWQSTPQATTTGQFLWTRTVTTYTDTSTSTGYSVSAHGSTGATGGTGATGKGISSTAVTYQIGTSGTVVPVGTWVSSPAATSPGEFLWSRTIITYTDASTSTAYAVSAHGATGAAGTPGTNGRGISSTAVTYQVHTNGTVAPTGTWQAGPQTTVPGQFLWTRTIMTYTDTTTVTSYSVSAHGTTGTGVSSTAVTYQVHTNGTTAPTGTWVATPQATVPGQFLWTRTITTYTDTTTATSYSVSAHGSTGATGVAGIGISSTAVTYQLNNSGTTAPISTWVASPPATSPGQFLWTRTVTTLTDASTSTSYSVSAHGATGATGSAGVGVSSSVVTYQVHTSATVTPTGSWLSFPAATSPGQFLWTRTIVTYTDTSSSTSYSVSAHGATGSPGTNGIGISSTAVTYQVHSNGTVAPTGTWQASPQATTTGQFLWTRTITTFTDFTTVTSYSVSAHGATGTTGSTGASGSAGIGVSSTAVTYQIHTNGTTAPTGTWLASPQATTTGQFLWTRTITTYTDASSTTAYSVSAHGATGSTGSTGAPGRGISSSAVTYQVHTDGTTAPTGTWQTSPQLTVPGQFLWTREVTTYTDATTSTSYSVAAHGTTGTAGAAGRGISSTAVTYQIHTNGTTAPTGTWVASPTATIPGQYLWTRTIITYTDAATSTAYSVSAHGSTGVGVSSTVVTYQVHTSATVTPTGTWLSSPAATTTGQFLWTRTITTYTDLTTSTGYSVSAHGSTGSTGNGISSTVVTYQLHTNGTTAPVGTWVSTPPATSTGQFLWTRIVITYTDLTTSTAYSVSAHGSTGSAGTPGTPGAAGVGVSSTAVTYQIGSSGTTAPVSTWLSTPQATSPGQFLWTRTITTYTDASTSTGYSVSAHGATGSTGGTGSTGAPGVGISSTVVTYQIHTNGTTAPTGTWVATPQATTTGQFLWTRTVTTMTDASVTTAYSVSAHGATGATGGTGSPGTPGIDATYVTLGNDAVSIPTDSTGATASTFAITVPFGGWIGNTRAAATIAASGLPAGITAGTNTAATASADGSLILNVATASTLGGTTSGEITLTIVCNAKTFTYKFSWAKAIGGATGGTGGTGSPGTSATSIDVGMSSAVIPCDSAGNTVAATTITIPFTGFVGATRAATTVAVTGLPTGITVQTNTAGTSGAAGSLVLAVASGSSLGGTTLGDITLTVTCNAIAFVQTFRWSKAIAGATGSTGGTGTPGTPGVDATYATLGNDAVSIPTDSTGTTTTTFAITVPFSGWVGNTRAAATIAATGLPAGITAGTNTAATSSADGSLILNVASASTLGGTTSGEITLTITCNSKIFTYKFSWAKAVGGATGGAGTPGASATSLDVGNSSEVIPCTSAGATLGATTITIPFTGWVGATRAAITVTPTGMPTGITVQTNTAGTSAAAGSLIFAVASGSTLGGTNTGVITLTFVCNSITFVQYFDWSKALSGATGGTGTPGKSVTSVTSYYILATTGSATPAAPTLNPPGGGWTLTEPAYVGNTELYRSELCVFSDATFTWSSVSKDSAYTASTQAITAANVADASAKGMIKASAVDPGHAVGRLWFQLDGSGNTIGIKISNGTAWSSYTLVADQILVPSSLGTASIKDNAVTARTINAQEVWTNSLWTDVLRVGDFIEANMVSSTFASELTLESNLAIQAIITTQEVQKTEIDAVEDNLSTTNTSVGNLTTKVGDVEGVATNAKSTADDAGKLAASNNDLITETRTWFRVDASGAHIGKSNTPFLTHIYPGKISITDGTNETSWTTGSMTVPVITVDKKATIMRHSFEPFPAVNPTGTIIRSLG